MKRLLAILLSSLVAACGGGAGTEDPYFFDLTSYDDYSRPVEQYTPPVNQVLFFPLALHFRTITKSYVSKVGTKTVTNYLLSGRMSTPTLTNGVYEAKLTTSRSFLGSTLFEGVSATPVSSESRRYEVKLNGVAQAEQKSASTSYYDTTYGLRIGAKGTNTYKVVDTEYSTALPEVAITGDAGDFIVYKVYSDSTKSNLIGADVLGYKILSTTVSANGEYKARVEYTTRSYSSQALLLGVTTSTDDVVYSLSSGAGANNVSIYSDDISGTTTSRILYTRVR